jgi:periplasmic protein TonB
MRTSICLVVMCAVSVVGATQTTQDTVYEAGPGITLPKIVKEVKAEYPKESMAAGVQGWVRMTCVVGRDGKPGNIEITESLEPRIDEAAIAALRQWEFEPGAKDGGPVAVRVTIEMSFTLK